VPRSGLGPRAASDVSVTRCLKGMVSPNKAMREWVVGSWRGPALIAAGLLAAFAALVLVVVMVPPGFTRGDKFDGPAERLKAENDVRTTLLQGIGGAVPLPGSTSPTGPYG
jgi:uncharacterized membrane protein YphA (DoxX/SURF4 family)